MGQAFCRRPGFWLLLERVRTQFASMFSEMVSLCGIPVLPQHIHRARICALYRQGAGSCVFGLSHRPSFPHQDKVAEVVSNAFQIAFDLVLTIGEA